MGADSVVGVAVGLVEVPGASEGAAEGEEGSGADDDLLCCVEIIVTWSLRDDGLIPLQCSALSFSCGCRGLTQSSRAPAASPAILHWARMVYTVEIRSSKDHQEIATFLSHLWADSTDKRIFESLVVRSADGTPH